MFCPYCGTESTQGLNYCKRCGANLGAGLQAGGQEASPAISNGAAWACGQPRAPEDPNFARPARVKPGGGVAPAP